MLRDVSNRGRSAALHAVAPVLAACALSLPARGARAWTGITRVDWPCPGCIVHAPGRVVSAPGIAAKVDAHGEPLLPLLVALHGDGGGARKLVGALQDACDRAGVVLFAPLCPADEGCRTGSFWQWYAGPGHDPAWLGAQIDAVTAAYPIDPDRTYAAGYSGGATYLGYYGPTNPERFAAIAYLAGGVPYGVPCPACKVPVLFVIGGPDPMLVPFARPLFDYYQACGGHEAVWKQLPGVSHEGLLDVLRAGEADRVLSWLLARPASCCSGAADAGVGADGGGDAAGAAGRIPDAGAASATEPAASAVAPGPRTPPPVPPAPGGCACTEGPAGDTRGSPEAVAFLAALFSSVRRRRRRAHAAEGASARRGSE
jgi:predicted esterase